MTSQTIAINETKSITDLFFIFVIVTGVLLLSAIKATGQETSEDDGVINRPAQITFFYPLGTNGVNTNVVNNFSLNILAGVNGGVNGFEAGGLFNSNKYDMKGFQGSGFMNYTGGYTNGVQISGFMNINQGAVKGLHGAGFMNISADSTLGVQAAGFANINGGKVNGAQAAGFANITDGFVKHFQGAGFINASRGMEGFQAAGFMNLNDGTGNGFQASGFANINTRDYIGAQMSGFLNIARHVRGVQLGFINICDSINGVPIGAINIVTNGYRRLEIFGSEALYGNIVFKMGVKHFYTIYHVGIQPSGGFLRWGLGMGLGTEITLSDNSYLNIDGIVSHINEDEFWTRDLNLLNQMRFIFGFEVAQNFSMFAGPTFNVMVSRYTRPGSQKMGSALAPWTIVNRTNSKSNIKLWPGISAGFKIG